MTGGSRAQRSTGRDRAGAIAFAEFQVDLGARTLEKGGTRLEIQRKPLDVLIHLIQAAPRLVPRRELLERHFSRTVNEESLTRCISTIRKVLDDTEDPPRFIETHRGEGYRFVAATRWSDAPSTTPAASRWRFGAWAAAALVIAAVIGLVLLRETDRLPDGRIDRIAVMPMISESAEQDWLATALTDHLLHTVSKIEGITVVAPGLIDPETRPEIAAMRLNVDAILASRFERTAEGSAIETRLVAARDGELLWSARIASREAFGSQQQIADLTRQVAVRLRPSLQLKGDADRVDPAAYREYLQGRYFLAQRTGAALYMAIEAFDAAVAIDPRFEEALLGAAEAWLVLPLYGATRPIESIPRARSLAERALDVSPDNAHARAVLGAIAMQFDWDWQAAEALLSEAVALNPNDATAQRWLGELYCYQHRWRECRRQFRVAQDLDPLSPVLDMQQGSVDYYAGNYEAALESYRSAAARHPGFAMGRYVLGLAYAGLGDWQRAVDAYESTMPELGLEIGGGPLAYALAKEGDVERARAVLADIEALAAERYIPPSKLAIVHLALGQTETAHELFLSAIEAHDDRLVYFTSDVHTRDLARDPRFSDIVRRIGLATEPH
ncbi:MAG: tetratricopeptide repeat protein [Woeseiaceae bacterium]